MAAVVGGFPGTIPVRPIEPDSGPSYGVAAFTEKVINRTPTIASNIPSGV